MNGNVRKKLQRKSLFIVESNNRDHEAHCQWNYKIVKDLNLLKNTSEKSSQKVCQFLSRDANASKNGKKNSTEFLIEVHDLFQLLYSREMYI